MLRNKNFWFILLTLTLLVILILIFSKKENTFKKIKLSNNNYVTNYTGVDFLDTIMYVGMDNLDLHQVAVQIRPLSEEAKKNFSSDIELRGMIYGQDNQYIIWIDKMNRQEAINTISHELIHLLQYRNKELIYDGIYIYWNKVKYDFKEIPYGTRPWEIDAFEKQVPLERKIKSVLY